MRAAYQRRFPFGWHELWWQARGTLLAGGVLFPDEESIGSYLHGSFAGSDFARKLASTGFELRYSLLRDVIKVGFLYDQLVFGAIDRTANPSPWRPQAQAGRRCICSWQTSSRWTSILRWDGRPTAARTSPPPSCCGRCSDVVQRIANDPSPQSGPHAGRGHRRVLDEPFLVVTFKRLEVVDWSMASPAPIEAPVQRGGFRCP